jgi:protein tyrosine phosphatase
MQFICYLSGTVILKRIHHTHSINFILYMFSCSKNVSRYFCNSAGVGRTGTFIAVDYLLQHIKDHDEVDIFNFVLEMRNNRLNMVQTEVI